MKLRIIAGQGRIFRFGDVIGMSAGPIPELGSIVADTANHKNLFKQLAAMVVRNDFAVNPFVAIRLGEEPVAFVFGDLTLTTANPSAPINGSESTTWVERALNDNETKFLHAGESDISGGPDPDIDAWDGGNECFLEVGFVFGGGFTFGTPAQPTTPSETAEPVEMPEPVIAVNPVEPIKPFEPFDTVEPIEDVEQFADGGEPSTAASGPPPGPLSGPPPGPFDDVRLGEGPLGADPPSSGEQPLMNDFDPFAFETDIQLDQIGAQVQPDVYLAPGPSTELEPPLEPQSELDPEPERDDPTNFGPLPVPLVPPPARPPADLPPPPIYAPPLANVPPPNLAEHAPPADQYAPVSDQYPPPKDHYPGPDESTTHGEIDPDGTTELIEGERIIRFDDGQAVATYDGLFVGRYPSKGGLPEGYEEVVIRGEHVSRVHWAFDIDADGQASIRDLGSTSGTFVEPADQAGSPIQVTPGTSFPAMTGATIRFGDRWAQIEV